MQYLNLAPSWPIRLGLSLLEYCTISTGKYEGKSKVTNRDWKETNGDNDIQTTFIFQHNLHTNLNTCPNVSQVPGNLRRKILVVAVGTTRTRQESVPPKDVALEDCLTWQAIFTVHGQHSFAAISFAHKNRTTPRCSIEVHVFRGAAIL